MTPAAELAELLLQRFGVNGKPDLATLCRWLGLRVREKNFDGFDGVLRRSKTQQKGIIGVNARIAEASRKRFMIAHEIAHFVIPYHRELQSPCETGSIDAFSRTLARPELEANEFAAELLMPERQVASRFALDNPSLAGISRVATEFETSLSATAWRFLELTQEACAIVWSAGGKSIWYRTNEALPFLMPVKSLPWPSSIAARLFAGETTEGGMRQVDTDAWFYNSTAERMGALWEDSVYLTNYDAVFTLLWAIDVAPEKAEEEEDELLADLDPQEFTLMRKRRPR